MSGRNISACLAAALLAGCASKPAPAPPAPVVRRAPPASPAPEPVVESVAADWPDLPLSAGEWTYAEAPDGSRAAFGGAGAASFTLRCDPGRRQVLVSRDGAAGPLRLRTSFSDRNVASGAALPASDPLLDEMAFSRGRFAVEAPGLERLIVPAWPEAAKVIEDCRG